MRINFPYILFGFFLMVSCSCEWPAAVEDPSENASIETSCTVVWRQTSNADGNQGMLIHNDILYYAEVWNMGAVAIHPLNGEILWRDSDRIEYLSRPLFFQNGNIGFIEYTSEEWALFLYEPNGSFIRSIHIDDRDYLIRNFHGTAQGNRVYWNASRIGLVYTDIIEDVSWSEDSQLWVAEPHTLYSWPPRPDGEDNWVNYIVPTIFNGVLYSGFNQSLMEAGTFFAVDLDNEEVLWEKKHGTIVASQGWPMEIRNNRLVYMGSRGYLTIFPGTGEADVMINGGDYSPHAYLNSSGAYYNGLVTFTTTGGLGSPNIFCIREDTGEEVWRYSFQHSFGSNPVTYEGITYLAGQGAIRLFNAETGEYLGYDDSIHGDIWQICNVLTYDDLMIFRNNEEVIAVRMDYRLDENGELWQVE